MRYLFGQNQYSDLVGFLVDTRAPRIIVLSEIFRKEYLSILIIKDINNKVILYLKLKPAYFNSISLQKPQLTNRTFCDTLLNGNILLTV